MWACASLGTSNKLFQIQNNVTPTSSKDGRITLGISLNRFLSKLSSKVSCEHCGVYEFDTECMC